MNYSEWKKLQTPFAVILFAFICLLLYTKLAGPLPFSVTSVQTTKQSSFQVTGEGKATAIPDMATITFGVTKQAATVADAQDQTNKAVDSVLTALKNQGIDTNNIKTTDYSVNPQYNYQAVPQTISGYQVSQTVQLKVMQLDKVNKVLDTVTANGANIVNQVTFGFDDAKQNDLENKAREDAVAQAKSKAENLARIAGFHLGRIVDVQENQNNPIPLPMMGLDVKAAPAGLGGGVQPSNVTPGENSVSVTVTLSYETY